MATRSDLDQLIDAAKLNPMAVQKAGIDFLEKVTDGEVEIVDASNAFVYLGEFAATLFANGVRKHSLGIAAIYPEEALTRMDLYHHMSDVDYIDTFAAPGIAKLGLAFNKDELIAKAVDTGISGVKKLVIGRNSQIMAGTYALTLQYPIEIRILAHGAITVTYDNSKISPMQTLETNKVDTSIDNYNENHDEYLLIEVPVYQMEQKKYTAGLAGSKTFDKVYGYNDQFYHCRAYASNSDGSWTEIKTTHSDQVFDPLKPTLLLSVLDGNQLRVRLPQVYYNTDLVTRSLRIDIFTTKGVVDVALNTYDTSQFVMTYRDFDNDDGSKYTAPMATMVDRFIVGMEKMTGGGNMISFEKLKERMITNNLGSIEIPITNVQIQSQLDRLTDAGFSCTTIIDNATNRLYLATRELPAPSVEEVSTGVGSAVSTLTKTIAEIITQADVADNGSRVTILPTTLYRNEGGFLSIVDKEEVDSILALSGDSLASRVSEDDFLYTPFHYVYDITDNVFTVRPYYFGDPELSRRFFVQDNATLTVGVSSSSHDFTRTDTGWKLRVMTDSTDSMKALDDDALFAQLAYIPVGESTRAFLNGTVLGRDPTTKEWIFEFNFDSNWDVDGNNSVYLNGFEVNGISPHPYPASMTQVFDIFYAVERVVANDDAQNSQIDQDMGKFLIDTDVIGVYHEQVTLSLGASLEGLWARCRSTIGEEAYLKYTETVYKKYTEDKPARNEDQSIKMAQDDDGKWYVVYEYRAGDTVMDNGQPVVQYEAGTNVIVNGAPVIANPRTIQRQVELCLFDGVYYFATAQSDSEYKTTIPSQIVEWVNVTLEPLRSKLLENTKLLFLPKGTIGQFQALVDSSSTVTMEAAQYFVVQYFVSEKVYKDEDLKDAIRKTTRSTITTMLKDPLVTQDELEATLKSTMGDDVIAVNLSGLGGSNDYRVVSMVDDSARLCIGKKLVAEANGTYSVADNIDIDFRKHAS